MIEGSQDIARLTPLPQVLALADMRVKPVAPRTVDLALAQGRALASDVMVPARPNAAVALRDGWAVSVEETLGAGSYSPVRLMRPPQRVECGQPMPPGTDSVLSADAVKVANGFAEVFVGATRGAGVLPPGGDSNGALALRNAGERLRATDIAAFAAAGLSRVTVREPRIHILPVRGSTFVNAIARLVAGDIERNGGVPRLETGRDLGLALAAESADGLVVIGGTGNGRNDTSVQTLAREGELGVHGVAITPGETAALGFMQTRPVLVLPGRLDAALSAWLLIGRHLLARLAGRDNIEPTATATLSRKIASPIGLAEFVPVRHIGDMAEPLAADYLPMSILARADGWIVVPGDSEGFPEGTKVAVRTWP